MIKYTGYAITFSEVPDEVSLCIEISNCPGKCVGCHSPYLREDIGKDLECDMPEILKNNTGNATCVCFMGEGNDQNALGRCIQMAKTAGFKTCLYLGRDDMNVASRYNLDYIKIGEYIQENGGLNHTETNQRFYRIDRVPVDITNRFWRKGE